MRSPPPDIFRYISDLLSISDLLNFQLVCKSIRRATRQVYEERVALYIRTPPIVPEKIVGGYMRSIPLSYGYLFTDDKPQPPTPTVKAGLLSVIKFDTDNDLYAHTIYKIYEGQKLFYCREVDRLEFRPVGVTYLNLDTYLFSHLDLLTQYRLTCRVEPKSIAKRRLIISLRGRYLEYLRMWGEVNELYRFNIFLRIHIYLLTGDCEFNNSWPLAIDQQVKNPNENERKMILEFRRQNEGLYRELLREVREL